jgi:hypothetical protein
MKKMFALIAILGLGLFTIGCAGKKEEAPATPPAVESHDHAAEGTPAEGAAPAEGTPAEGAAPAEGAPAEGAAPAEAPAPTEESK